MILSHANVEVIKEPRGFIKFLQIIVAICAFATAVSNHSETGFQVTKCNNTETNVKRTMEFYYPYNLHESTKFDLPLCEGTNQTTSKSAACYGDYSGSAQFFVFVGVAAFLLCLGSLIFYILADDKYHQVSQIPTADFVVTVIFAVLWFVSSSAWADAVVKIKHYTDPGTLLLNNSYNFHNLPECFSPVNHCQADPMHAGDYRNVNISIVLGYLCTVVWVGNLWFLYKETKWGKEKNLQQGNSQNLPPSPSSAI